VFHTAALFVGGTLSVKFFGFARSPERGSFWRIHMVCTLSGNCAVTAKKLPPRGSWRTNVSLRGFGAPKANGKPFPQRRTFEESGAANAVSLYAPLREKAIQENSQIFLNYNYKNIFR
jgi:hypothetical protein